MQLNSNKELYQYLIALAGTLKEKNEPTLAGMLIKASKNIIRISDEFLGESRIALQAVLKEGSKVLGTQQQTDVQDVIRQINDAFANRK